MRKEWKRPQTAAEVCEGIQDAEDFGRSVRDWQHELRKIHNRPDFAKRIHDTPPLLRNRLNDGGQCDAYLAAYVEWLSERAGIDAPRWVNEPKRIADKAWFDYPPLWIQSFISAPAAFRRHGVFTKPDNVLNIKRGRPSVSVDHKRRMNAERQKRYRSRVAAKLARLKALEAQLESS